MAMARERVLTGPSYLIESRRSRRFGNSQQRSKAKNSHTYWGTNVNSRQYNNYCQDPSLRLYVPASF